MEMAQRFHSNKGIAMELSRRFNAFLWSSCRQSCRVLPLCALCFHGASTALMACLRHSFEAKCIHTYPIVVRLIRTEQSCLSWKGEVKCHSQAKVSQPFQLYTLDLHAFLQAVSLVCRHTLAMMKWMLICIIYLNILFKIIPVCLCYANAKEGSRSISRAQCPLK